MESLINRVEQQLNNNHAVEADDIQALVDFAEYVKEKVELRKMNIDPNDNRVMAGRNYELKWLIDTIDSYNANT